jgi:hypothetical protein
MFNLHNVPGVSCDIDQFVSEIYINRDYLVISNEMVGVVMLGEATCKSSSVKSCSTNAL